MSEQEKPKPRRGKRKTKLPRSGLASEVFEAMASDDADTEAAATNRVEDTGAAAQQEPTTGPESVYEFADSLDDEQVIDQSSEEHPETWVTFELGGEIFALPVSHVQEILRVGTITHVPHAPHPVRGVTNKRGRVLPVVDLRIRLGLVKAEPGPRSRILVVESRSRLLGLLVDGVQQVLRLMRSEVQAPPPDVMTEQSDYIIGVYDIDDRLAILLDVDRVLLV